MKEIITNYLKNDYSIELRVESSGFSAEELKKYRDNLVSAIEKYWDAPDNKFGKSFVLNKRVHEICDKILSNSTFDIQKKTICDNTDIVVFWPAMPRP